MRKIGVLLSLFLLACLPAFVSAHGHGVVQPLGATFPLEHLDGIIGEATLGVASRSPIGMLVAHICRRCGATARPAATPATST